MNLIDQLHERIVFGDGAMATLLMEEGLSLDACFEELCLTAPDRVRAVHEQYLGAGAEVIETNSFGANAVRLEKHGLEGKVIEINRAAVQIAKAAAGASPAWVAGSVGPLGMTAGQAREHEIDRAAVFREQLSALIDAGVDLVILETFLDLPELLIALAAHRESSDVPAVTSVACNAEGRLASGETIAEAFRLLREGGAEVVGANCVNGPQAMVKLFEHVPLDGLLSAFPNAGHPKYHEGRYLYFTTAEYFAGAARELVEQGARLVGGCCGIGPRHIAAMVKALRGLKPATRKTIRVIETPRPKALALEGEETSILDLIAQGRQVIVTELDPPKTLDLEKFFRGAEELTRAGSDAITLADNSLAILRVSNLAAGAILKHRYGITPLLHLSCRDRNLLGLQSELLGMAAMGMRHVLPLTGDPSKVGDHPGAASVYDVTSIELIGIIKRLNEGYNHIGKAIKVPTRFVVGCTFNPNAKNMDAQVSRLERKIAAGAHYVMTQPVFDVRLVELTAKRTAHLKVPVLTGVWPLLNGRQAEFLHNEVPGIVIPDDVRAGMAGLEGDEGRRRGIEIAKEVCRAVLDQFPGVYLITPFLNYDTTLELTRFVRER